MRAKKMPLINSSKGKFKKFQTAVTNDEIITNFINTTEFLKICILNLGDCIVLF